MPTLSSALSDLPLDATTQSAILSAASTLRTKLHDSKALHEALKLLGVAKIGLRQKVAIALEQCDQESETASRLRASLASCTGLEAHADALCAHAEKLISLATSSSKELHDALRSCGVKALGTRQQVVIAIQKLLPPTVAAVKSPPRKPKPAVAPPPPATKESDDEELALEANDDDDDVLELEENPADDDGLALETNDDEDDGGLALEENPARTMTMTTAWHWRRMEAATRPTLTDFSSSNQTTMPALLLPPPRLPKSQSMVAAASHQTIRRLSLSRLHGSLRRPRRLLRG